MRLKIYKQTCLSTLQVSTTLQRNNFVSCTPKYLDLKNAQLLNSPLNFWNTYSTKSLLVTSKHTHLPKWLHIQRTIYFLSFGSPGVTANGLFQNIILLLCTQIFLFCFSTLAFDNELYIHHTLIGLILLYSCPMCTYSFLHSVWSCTKISLQSSVKLVLKIWYDIFEEFFFHPAIHYV